MAGACVASVSVRFRSKLTEREMKREPFVARSLTLVPRSLLLNRTETLATQAINFETFTAPGSPRIHP